MPLQDWRLLLPRVNDAPMDLDDELFQALASLEQEEHEQSIQLAQASTWSIDQADESIALFFDDDTELTAKIQVVGTFDGESFVWAWSNPDIDPALINDSLKLKEYGQNRGWAIFSEPNFAATIRDGYALMALAAKLCEGQAVYAAEAKGQVYYLTLRQLDEAQPGRQNRPMVTNPSILDTLNSLYEDQLGIVQLKTSELKKVENICRRGFVQSQAGEHLAAAASFDEAWEAMGEYATSQEPASWIKLAKGNALCLAGKFEEAASSLLEAEQLYGCPDPGLLYQRLGQCYAALGDKSKSNDMFARVYVTSGDQGLAWLSNPDRDSFLNALQEKRKVADQKIAACKTPRRRTNELTLAAATVTCLIEELNAFEHTAFKLQEKARKSRVSPHEESAEDLVLSAQLNTLWTWLMAVWCTPIRQASCTSIQYPPVHDPKQEELAKVYYLDDGAIAVQTSAADSFGSKNSWRYELEHAKEIILVRQIYAIWDDEEYASI